MAKQIVLEDTGQRRYPNEGEFYSYLLGPAGNVELNYDTSPDDPEDWCGKPEDFAILKPIRNDFDTRTDDQKKLDSIREIVLNTSDKDAMATVLKVLEMVNPKLPGKKSQASPGCLTLFTNLEPGPSTPHRDSIRIGSMLLAEVYKSNMSVDELHRWTRLFIKAPQLRAALMVILTTNHIGEYLKRTDPKAYQQAEDAVSGIL